MQASIIAHVCNSPGSVHIGGCMPVTAQVKLHDGTRDDINAWAELHMGRVAIRPPSRTARQGVDTLIPVPAKVDKVMATVATCWVCEGF